MSVIVHYTNPTYSYSQILYIKKCETFLRFVSHFEYDDYEKTFNIKLI